MISSVVTEHFWTEQRGAAALGLAEGKSQVEVAALVGVTDRTLRNWLTDARFVEEVDRLSLMVGVASRAERLRIVNRIVKQRVRAEGDYITERDLLDWLKFAQSETDGARIDLSKLAEMLTGESAQANTASDDNDNTRLLAQSSESSSVNSVIEVSNGSDDSEPSSPSSQSSSSSGSPSPASR